MAIDSPTAVNAFHLGGEYWFALPDDALESVLAPFYDRSAERCVVRDPWFEDVTDRLRSAGYRLERIENPRPYCVVQDPFSSHAPLLRDALGHWVRGPDHVFLLPTQAAVRRAIERGADPLEDSTGDSTPIAIGAEWSSRL